MLVSMESDFDAFHFTSEGLRLTEIAYFNSQPKGLNSNANKGLSKLRSIFHYYLQLFD